MKIRLRVDARWLETEAKGMARLRRRYHSWEESTLKTAKEATDLRSLRELFYSLGDRWEWDQTTGSWLAEGEPLETIGLVLRMPGLKPETERRVLYAVMAYSKGFTAQFDHLGDKERIIIEQDTKTGRISCWSTSGHGAMDLFPVDLTSFGTIDAALRACYIVAQPGDHALRLELPSSRGGLSTIIQRFWNPASGNRSFALKEVGVVTAEDMETKLSINIHRYAKAVIDLEQKWKELGEGAAARVKEVMSDKVPPEIEERDRLTMREVKGLLHVSWFRPPANQLPFVQGVRRKLESQPMPTERERALIPYVKELAESLDSVLERAKYLKWKSVMEERTFSQSELFRGIDISELAKQAFATAVQDILNEHTLSYIGYPERATMEGKMLRIVLGMVVPPARLLSSFLTQARRAFRGRLFRRDHTAEDKDGPQ
ncbi:MAG: hypothetical protein C4K47_06415 [Candidatus Thorarchaeota archaeon]|nr:MAG: hypothetical protein C4K47_06415 [Candidatus Thorarchaeota archaeon]